MRVLRVAVVAGLLTLASSGLTVAATHGTNAPLGGAGCAMAAGVHHASAVAEHADGTVLRRCVAFTTDTISGVDLFDRSGIQHAYADYGSLGKGVCQVDSEPRQYPPSCVSPDTSSYWVIFTSRANDGGRWTTSSSGISGLSFADGDAEGFRYDPQTGTPQAPASPLGTCGAAAAATRAPASGPPAAAGARPSSSGTAQPRATGAGSGASPSPVASAAATAAPGSPSVVATPQRPASAPSPLAPVLAASAGGGLLGLLILRLRRTRR